MPKTLHTIAPRAIKLFDRIRAGCAPGAANPDTAPQQPRKQP